MSDNFKEKLDMAIGKAAVFVSEQKDKAASFMNEQKDKAAEYLDAKQKLYKTKTALDDATKRLDSLFNELGRVSYFRRSTTPGRKAEDIRNEIKPLLIEVDALQEAYDALKPDVEDEIEDTEE